jgi:membrane dipeptidase
MDRAVEDGVVAVTAVIDCHSDVMIDVYKRRQNGERAVLANVHLPAYQEGGIVASVCIVGGDASTVAPFGLDQAHRSSVALLDALYADAAESEGRVAVATSAAALAHYIDRGTFAVLPALEGAMPIEGDLRLLEDLHARGVRMVGLTWNSRNALAVGLDSGDGGLTDLGREAIGLMNELGLVIDLSHASPATFWDVAQLSRAPLFASHANARAVHDHPRNLDDDQLNAISRSGGAVGLVFCPSFIGAQPVGVDDVLAHVEHFRRTVGDHAIVIGADYCDYAIDEMTAEILAHAGSIYDESSLHYPPGLHTAQSMQQVITRISRAGFDSAGLENVGCGNFLRVLGETEGSATAA